MTEPFLVMGLHDKSMLCAVGRKCVRRDGHEGACWPLDDDQKKEEAKTP